MWVISWIFINYVTLRNPKKLWRWEMIRQQRISCQIVISFIFFEKNDSLTFFLGLQISSLRDSVNHWRLFWPRRTGFKVQSPKTDVSLPSNKKFLISLILFLIISCWKKWKISCSAPALRWWENKTCSAWLITFFRVNNVDFPKISKFCQKTPKLFHDQIQSSK